MSTLSPDELYINHVNDLAKGFINPATDAPYTARGVLKWCSTHLGFSPLDNRFTARQTKVLKAWYDDVVIGKGQKNAFLQQYGDDLQIIWAQQGKQAEAAAEEPVRSAEPAGAEANEDGLFGAMVPVMDSLNADLQYVGNVCAQAEDYVVEQTLDRVAAMPNNISRKLTAQAHRRFGTGQQVRSIPTMGAIAAAFQFSGTTVEQPTLSAAR